MGILETPTNIGGGCFNFSRFAILLFNMVAAGSLDKYGRANCSALLALAIRELSTEQLHCSQRDEISEMRLDA